MRITTFRHAGGIGWGLAEDDGIVDLSTNPSMPYADASDALRSETVMDLALAACGVAPQHRIADVEVLAPLPAPGRVLRLAADGSGLTLLERPEILGPGTDLPDGEPLLAVVVGSPTRDVPRDRAVEHLLGVTDAVLSGSRLRLGPWLVSRDETGDLDLLHTAQRALADIVSEGSRGWSLSPGDVLLVPAG